MLVVGERTMKSMCNDCFPSTGEDYVWGSSCDGYKCTGMFALAATARPMNLIDNFTSTSAFIPFEEDTNNE